MGTTKHSIAIVGAGIAGATVAYALARRGFRSIVILERDQTPGAHSTGRNAAILRSLIPDPALRLVARESASFYRKPPEGFCAHAVLDPVGIFLAAREQYGRELVTCIGSSREENAPTRIESSQLYQRIPLVAPGLTSVLYQPDEGVLDAHAILHSFLDGACRQGAELRTSCAATSLRVKRGKVEGLETSAGFLSVERVVIAGGGWAADLSTAVGYPMPLTPCRRHLLVTEPLPQVDRRWPVLWIVGDEFYFRPESGGLLMCACDTVPMGPEQGEVTDAAEVERIAAKAAQWLPSLADARVARAWAGVRTFAPDDRFVVGPDPRLEGLYWAAGLGGHGITCAPVIGELAAQWIAEGSSSHPSASALNPARLFR
jgi:glycine/D-amino acid oxidase-like deaminating enzyme